MMRNIFETGFYYLYLVFIIGLGIYLLIKKKNGLFALACIILGFGDAFHLIPRAIGLYTGTLDNPDATLAMWLGVGKLITSITMTIFYILIYLFIFDKVKVKRNLYMDVAVLILLLVRVGLCALPQNEWLKNGNDVTYGIARNVPFVLLGALVVYFLFKYFRKVKYFKLMWLAVILSFGFYIPVVIWASSYSWVGMLMLPKTVCYMWIGFMGLFNAIKVKEE
ncbi:MAG: hypothetical protein K5906_02780 [Bacilli bacterium]|nr:hypothetical protein [Bacilli bacterium]